MSEALAMRMRPVPRVNSALLAALALIALVAVMAAWIIADQLLGGALAWGSLLVVLSGATVTVLLQNSRRPDDRDVVLEADHVIVPIRRWFGRRATRLSFDELRSIELVDGRSGFELTLNVPRELPITVRARALTEGDLPAFTRALTAAAVAANPELRIAQALFERRNAVPWVALVLVLVLVLMFFVSLDDGANRAHRLIALGGLNGWLVGDGEVFRLGAGALLHGDWTHLLVNSVMLLVIGLRLEYVTGPLQLAGASVSGILAGNVCAYLWGDYTVVIGASGGVFALLGLYAHTLTVRRRHLPTRTQFAPDALLLGSLLMLFLPLPGAAQWVHAGGFVGGLAWSLLAAPRPAAGQLPLAPQPHRYPQHRWGMPVLALAAWSLVVVSSACGLAASRTWDDREPHIIERMARDPSARLGTLDLVAWYAMQHHDTALLLAVKARLEAHGDLNASAAASLAALLLALGDPVEAARRANDAAPRNKAARELLVRAELEAFARTCAPVAYSARAAERPVPAPIPAVKSGQLWFSSTEPLYVHARVRHHHLMVPTGVPVATAASVDEVIVLGYDDRLPLRRKPRVALLNAVPVESACGDGER